MADANENLQETLKPFYQRATEAEDRIRRLEAALASNKYAGNEELLKKISKLQTELEEGNAKLNAEQRKVKELTLENEKQKYRIGHLVRALKEADERLKGHISEATDQTSSSFQDMKI